MEHKKALLEALDLIQVMGKIIRTLDTEKSYREYWLNDGDYVPAILKIDQALEANKAAEEIQKTEDNLERFLILNQLNKISINPAMRPHFQLLNYTDDEENEVETEWIPIDVQSAQALIDFLKFNFQTLK